ncbi:hypothetical protein N9850_07350 [Granulosicoccus sp.]|nr:hypothetical protein [Granulosicoccus sp.]MDB4223574.1 hypothetical protein [Granulosicoccus sp.]
MRNYLRRLDLPRKASPSEIQTAVQSSMEDTTDFQSLADAENVLSDKIIRTYYERTYTQYEAISAAIDCLDSPAAVDSQQWRDRIVEFEPIEE